MFRILHCAYAEKKIYLLKIENFMVFWSKQLEQLDICTIDHSAELSKYYFKKAIGMKITRFIVYCLLLR